MTFCLPVPADNPYRPPAGARESGMAFVSIMSEGFWTSFHNSASLPSVKSISFGAGYENRFGIKELSTRTAALIIPAGEASVGSVYSYFGYADFRREMVGISCGLPVSQKISAGIQIDYFSEKTAGEYLNTRILTFEAGLLLRVSEGLTAGVHAFNPVPDAIRHFSMPSALRAGIGSKLNSQLFAGFEVEMVTGMKPDLRTGLEYEIIKNFWIRGGYRSAMSSFSFGLGYLLHPGKIDIAFSTHEQLGITSNISIVFTIN
jgi:hypothetical protein